jgi:hypothetical protein
MRISKAITISRKISRHMMQFGTSLVATNQVTMLHVASNPITASNVLVSICNSFY